MENMSRPSKSKGYPSLERPLPATPPTPPLSSPMAYKKQERTKLQKSIAAPVQRSLERSGLFSASSPLQSPTSTISSFRHVSGSSSGSSRMLSGISKITGASVGINREVDPDITPRPLNLMKRPISTTSNKRYSFEADGKQEIASRWSTSTSSFSNDATGKKESKKTIFGIPLSFGRRAKSEQIPASLKIHSGFFGGKFGGSKLDVNVMGPRNPHNTPIEPQWQSSRASSQMTIRYADGHLSDEELILRNFEEKFHASREKEKTDATLKSRIPQRRHTLTGSLLEKGVVRSASLLVDRLSRRSSAQSSKRSSSNDSKGPVKGLFSLFPKPPKRDPSEVMQMLSRNATMPLIMEGAEFEPGGRLRTTSSPLPVNLRTGIEYTVRHQRQASDMTVRQNNAHFYSSPTASVGTTNLPTTPHRRNTLEAVPFSTPKSAAYMGAQRKPVLTYLDLQVTADTDTIEVGEIKETWVVVEMNGYIGNNRETSSPRARSLDAIFLLDLSQNTSEQALANLKSMMGFILQNLTGTRSDSFGIAAFTSASSCEVLMPMAICNHQAKHHALMILDRIKAASDPSSLESSFANVVRLACSMFMPGLHGKNKNLIILSSVVPMSQQNMVDIRGFEEVKVHVVGINSLYWPVGDNVFSSSGEYSGGFCFTTSAMEVIGPEHNRLEKSQNLARRFIRALRAEQDIGMLKDLEIIVRPGLNVRVKAIMGKTDISTLRPGERATLLLNLEVFYPGTMESDGSDDGLESLQETLYATLGMKQVDLVNIDIAYKHTLLPETTILTATGGTSASLFSKDSLWNPSTPSLHSQLESGGSRLSLSTAPTSRQSFVRKALIQKVVSQHRNPKDALTAIENMTHTTKEKDLDYCDVVRELRYQMRIWNGRRRGRVLGFGSNGSDAMMSMVDFARTVRGPVSRPYSFENYTDEAKKPNFQNDRPPTPALTNDSFSVGSTGSPRRGELMGYDDEGSDGSIRRIVVEDEVETVDNSPITVVASEPLKYMQPIDSATKLWKRIEGAAEVGSIGDSSIATIDTTTTSTDGYGESQKSKKKKKKSRKKKKNKNKGKDLVEPVNERLAEETGSDGSPSQMRLASNKSLANVKETDCTPFLI